MTVIKKTNPVNPNKPWLADVSYIDWQGQKARTRKYFATRKEATNGNLILKIRLLLALAFRFRTLLLRTTNT